MIDSVKQTKGFPPRFGDEDSARSWALECLEKRATQLHPLAVAPLSCVITFDERRLGPGDEVRLDRDFVAVPDRMDDSMGCRSIVSGSSPTTQLRRLIDDGVVLVRDIGPSAA